MRADYLLESVASQSKDRGSPWHWRAPTLDGAVPRSARSMVCVYAIGRSMVRIASETSTHFHDTLRVWNAKNMTDRGVSRW